MRSFFILTIFILLPITLLADVYRWTDEQGKTHYSTKPPADGAKPAVLPAIKKEKFVPKVPKLASCADHGGIDCTKGADEDGSVVCRDGFKNASMRFTFSCSAPKLEITEITDTDGKGIFTVFVRNLTSVEAKDVEVLLETVKADGPKNIDPLGLEGYIFTTSLAKGAKPAASNFKVKCANCD